MRRYLEGSEDLYLYTRYENPTLRELEHADEPYFGERRHPAFDHGVPSGPRDERRHRKRDSSGQHRTADGKAEDSRRHIQVPAAGQHGAEKQPADERFSSRPRTKA